MTPALSVSPSVPWTVKDVFLVFITTAALCVVIILSTFALLAALAVFWTPAGGDAVGLVRKALFGVHDAYLILVFYAASCLAIRLCILRRYGLDVRRLFFISPAPFKDIGAGAKGYLVFCGAVISITFLIASIAAAVDMVWGGRAVEGVEAFYAASQLEQLEVVPIAQHSMGVVLILLLGPFFEELVFRGFLYRALRRRFVFGPAALLSSFVFALLHGYFFLFPYVFVLGLALTFLYERRGNLVAPLTFHVLNNSVVLAFFFFH